MSKIMVMSSDYDYLEDILSLSLEGWEGIIRVDMAGSRWSSKTKSLEVMSLKALHLPISVQAMMAKYTVAKARSFYKEFVDTAGYYDMDTLRYNKTDRTIRYKNNEIMVVGYKTNKSESQGQLGQFRPINPDLLIVGIDEISEWDGSNQRSLVHQAAGGGKMTVYVDTTNPWSEFNWKIQQMLQKLALQGVSWDEETMRKDNQIFIKVINKIDHKRKYIDMDIMHVTNHNINEFLTEAQHQILRDEWKIDPDMARVTDLGLPGVESGSIYSFQMPKIRNYLPIGSPTDFIGGMDWINTNNHVVALFATVSQDYLGVEKINIEEAFIYGTNKERNYYNSMDPESSWEPLQHPEIHELITLFYEKAYEKWGGDGIKRLEIGIDNANLEAQNSINKLFEGYDVSHLFEVHPATKKKIRERININKNAAGKNILKVNPKLKLIMGAFESLRWDEKHNTTDPRDKQNQLVIDIMDAVDYLVSKLADKIIEEK